MKIELLGLIVPLVIGSLAAFFSIVLWSKTRDSAWMFVIGGILTYYVKVLYTSFETFGIIQEGVFVFHPALRIVFILENLPSLFFLTAIIIMIFRVRYK